MRISRPPQLTDEELFTPQELYSTLRVMSKDASQFSTGKKSPKPNKVLTDLEIMFKEGEVPQPKNEKKTKKFMGLKKIIQEQKIKSLIRNFVTKLKRNLINSKPVEYQPFEEEKKSWFENGGFTMPVVLDSFISLACIAQITFLTLLYTLSLVFQTVLTSQVVTDFQIFSIFFYSTEVFINFVTIKSVEGRKLVTLKQIGYYYLKSKFPLDLLSIVILIIDLSVYHSQFMMFARLIIIMKLFGCMEKLERLENLFIDNFYKEQYWGLIKVFILNFCFAHFLAIILVAMAQIDPEKSWIASKGWSILPWYEIYSWAYYWGTTIMLTVGFGDISATNFQEAICLTLIETFSCITLAYNINCVGNLINNIRSQDIEKNKNHKIFNKLTEKNDIPEELNWRINNYIEQSTNIKKKFNFEEEHGFISKLPQGLKADFLKESNKKIFENLVFFRNLTEKTLLNFAQKIEMRICHPEEIIRRKDGEFNVFILKEGYVGFVCKKTNFDFNDTLIDEIKVRDGDPPFLMSLDFISHEKKQMQMKSLKYSILYCLNYHTTISILQGSELDYEHFCQLRDKSRHVIDEYEVFTCELCNGHHMKFDCPKIHYIPIEQHIVLRYLYNLKKITSSRMPYERNKKNFATLRMVRNDGKEISPRKITSCSNFERGSMMTSSRKYNRQKTYQRLKTFTNESVDIFHEQSQSYDENTAVAKKMFDNISVNIVDEVTKIINAQKVPEIWILECDEVKNYKFYFNQNNANNLRSIYSGK